MSGELASAETSESELLGIREPWSFLMGIPPMEEYLGFVQQASGSSIADLASAAKRWRAASSVFSELMITEVGNADQRSVAEIPPAQVHRGVEYLANPGVAATYLTSTPCLGLIDLDDLVVFQRRINLRYTSELQANIGSWDVDSADFFNFCLNVEQPEPEVNGIQANQNTFVFSSRSTDARFLGYKLLEAGAVPGQVVGGRPTKVVVLYVGYGVNAINVLDVNGRLILNNGSHRAYALKASGASRAIAVVQRLTRQEELMSVPTVHQNPGIYLTSPRPPMLKDYFNPSLTEVLEAPRRVRQIRMQYGFQVEDAPG